MKTNLLQLIRKHPKLFLFLYRDIWLNRRIRREAAKWRKQIAKRKDTAWARQDRCMYDLLAMYEEIIKRYYDL